MTAKAPWTVKGFIPERISCLKSQLPVWIIQFCLLSIILSLAGCAPQTDAMPTRTLVQNPIQAFRLEIQGLQKKYNIPGMSVAILQNQQTIFADGLGWFVQYHNEVKSVWHYGHAPKEEVK